MSQSASCLSQERLGGTVAAICAVAIYLIQLAGLAGAAVFLVARVLS